MPTATVLPVRTADGRALHAEVQDSGEPIVVFEEPEALPDVPLTIISGTLGGRLEGGQRPAFVAAHRARAHAAPQGRHVEAPRSGHMVPFTDPGVVAEVVRTFDLAGTRAPNR